MESKPKSLGRAYLVGKLRELGLSRRDAVRILNFVLNEMAQALRRREPVEFPLGTLRRVRHFHEEEGQVPGEDQNYLQEAVYDQARARRRVLQAAEWRPGGWSFGVP